MLQNFTYNAQFVLHNFYVKYYAVQIRHFISLILSYLNYKIMSLSSLFSSSTVQHIINNLSMYVYKHFKFIFVSLVTLFNTHFDKMITTDSLKSHNPVKSVHCTQILSVVLAIFAYYPDIIFNVFAFLLWSKLCWHNR